MNAQRQKASRRKGQAMVRTVFGLGTVTSGGLAYLLSGANPLEAIVVPSIVMGIVVFAVIAYSRVRKTQEWSAVWDAYAEREGSHESFNSPTHDGIFSWAGTN